VIENKVYEGTECLKAAIRSGMTCQQVMVTSAKVLAGGAMKQ